MPPKKKPGKGYDPTRRKLLQALGLGGAALAGTPVLGQIRIADVQRTAAPGADHISVKLLRPHDLLSLELRYFNFTLSGNSLVKKGNPAYVAVIFPPQAMSEQAWFESESGMETPGIPGKMYIGGESRLVFQVPADLGKINLQLEEMLAWEKYDLVVNSRAKESAKPRKTLSPSRNIRVSDIQKKLSARDVSPNVQAVKGISKDEKLIIANTLLNLDGRNPGRNDAIINIRGNMLELAAEVVGPPGRLETSLEVPTRMYLSPTRKAGWAHATKLSPDAGVLKATNRLFELWHTRMGIKTTKGIDESELTNEERILRVLWADDANKDYQANLPAQDLDPLLGLTSITNKRRHQLVHESGNFQIPNFSPEPVKARKLFLTTLGAWLTSEFTMSRKKLQNAGIISQREGKDNAFNVLSWKHIATMGREHYVEIVSAGNIFPFGHEAVKVEITERKPHPGTGTAANFKREFVIITEPVKYYNYRDSNNTFLEFCFSSVEFITTVSPLLDKTKKPLGPTSGTGMSSGNQFVITTGNNAWPFKIKAIDLNGNPVDFAVPVAYISTEAQDNGKNIEDLVTAYQNAVVIGVNTPLNGQKFTLAPPVKNGCDTAYVGEDISFGARVYKDTDEPQGYLPIVKEAKIVEPAYQRLTGVKQAVSVSLVSDDNPGHVFAKFNFPQGVNFAGQTDKTGGLAAPNFSLSGLSKLAGAFGGDIDKFKNKIPDPNDFFKVVSIPDPKLFGVFKLSDILSFVEDASSSSWDISKPLLDRMPKIPNLVNEETETEYITTYVIKPQLKAWNLGVFASFDPKSGSSFSIVTQVRLKKSGSESPSFSTEAAAKQFSIGIMDKLININFEEISFKVLPGKKADVSVKMTDEAISFGGPLSFINAFNSLIDPAGFSDPPYLDVSLTGIKCGYTLALPNLQLGAFTLSNLSLGAEVNLPFTGGPLTIGFRFCERQQPFTLTVSCLGGGGFFGMEADLNGLRMIEASLEFGAAASINLGVASGAVSIMGGVYFKMTLEGEHNSTQLTGYIRINGAVSVLGLITASIELYLALTYLMDKHKAYGEATLKIKVEVLFFSKTVTLHTTRTLAGSGSDPNFQMAVKKEDWLEYCAAFAA